MLEVKKRVASAQGQPEDSVATMVLVHKGKVLADDATLDAAGVTEASFVVVMNQKAKAPPKPAPAPTPAPAPAPAPAAAPAAAPAPAAAAATPAASTPSAAAAATAGDGLVTGAALEETLTNMMSMGFEREQCVKARSISHWSPYDPNGVVNADP